MHTETGVIVGTVGYISPEQARGEAADARSDIFALGCILYEVLAGRHPFTRGTTLATVHAIANEDPSSIESANASAPSELSGVTFKALAKDPAQRYQAVSELAAGLRAFIRDNPGASIDADAVTAVRSASPIAARLRQHRAILWPRMSS